MISDVPTGEVWAAIHEIRRNTAANATQVNLLSGRVTELENAFDALLGLYEGLENRLEQVNNRTTYAIKGGMKVPLSDWIIRGAQGELYPCNPDIFAATQEEEGRL